MTEQIPYGAEFLKQLTVLGRQTPFSYRDLQQIKSMSREGLAERLKLECPQIAEFVRRSSAREVAELVHRKRVETAAASSHAFGTQGAASLLELIVQLFSATA